MVDETEFDIMDADHESRINDEEDNEPYCINCGEDEELDMLGNYASSTHWKCRKCDEDFMWSNQE